jgi:hypothetical protein
MRLSFETEVYILFVSSKSIQPRTMPELIDVRWATRPLLLVMIANAIGFFVIRKMNEAAAWVCGANEALVLVILIGMLFWRCFFEGPATVGPAPTRPPV